MSRTTVYKFVYFSEATAIAIVVFWLFVHFQLSSVWAALIPLALFVPGRILGFFWRDLLRGLRLLRQKQFSESKRHSLLFLEQLRRRPWMKHLIWLGSGSYTRDPEVMALNNLGAAEMMLGEIDAARENLQASIDLDPKCPLAYFNMHNLHKLLGDEYAAAEWLAKARERGFGTGPSDRAVQASQARFAERSGKGVAPSLSDPNPE